jgi:hypothetical protein
VQAVVCRQGVVAAARDSGLSTGHSGYAVRESGTLGGRSGAGIPRQARLAGKCGKGEQPGQRLRISCQPLWSLTKRGAVLSPVAGAPGGYLPATRPASPAFIPDSDRRSANMTLTFDARRGLIETSRPLPFRPPICSFGPRPAGLAKARAEDIRYRALDRTRGFPRAFLARTSAAYIAGTLVDCAIRRLGVIDP